MNEEKHIAVQAIKDISNSIALSDRTDMIRVIFEYSGDEYEDINSVKLLATENDGMLRQRLNGILKCFLEII